MEAELPIRLSAQLLKTTWQQCELDMNEDLQKLSTWANDFNTYASQQASDHTMHILYKTVLPTYAQGGLDMKYLSDRFQKGKEAVQHFQAERQKCLAVKNLMFAHQPIVEKQAAMGAST